MHIGSPNPDGIVGTNANANGNTAVLPATDRYCMNFWHIMVVLLCCLHLSNSALIVGVRLFMFYRHQHLASKLDEIARREGTLRMNMQFNDNCRRRVGAAKKRALSLMKTARCKIKNKASLAKIYDTLLAKVEYAEQQHLMTKSRLSRDRQKIRALETEAFVPINQGRQVENEEGGDADSDEEFVNRFIVAEAKESRR